MCDHIKLHRDRARAALNYTAAANRWLMAKPRTQEMADECLALATAYRDILVKLLDCLNSLPPTANRPKEIAGVEKSLELLDGEMKRGYPI